MKKLILPILIMTSFSAGAFVYDDISIEGASCSPERMLFPLEDVEDNMNFFRRSMGRWQITNISDDNVIMGSGYRFAVKHGKAGSSFCVPETYVVDDQVTLTKIAQDGSFLERLLSKFKTVKLITSDGNWIPALSLPSNAFKNQRLIVERKATWGTTVSYKYGSLTGYTPIKLQDQLDFVYDGEKWIIEPNYIISSQHEISEIAADPSILAALLDKHTSVKILLQDGRWARNLTVKEKPFGSMLTVERQSTYGVNVEYGTAQITPPRGSTTVFINSGIWWVYSSKTISDNRTIRALGNNPAKLKQNIDLYGNLIVSESDGNWTPTFTLPAANDLGKNRTFTLYRNSTYHSNIVFPNGVTLAPRKNTKTTFFSGSIDGWSLIPQYSVYKPEDISSVDSPEKIKALLDQYGNLGITISDNGYLAQVTLPDDAQNGEFVEFGKTTIKPVTIQFSGKTLALGYDSLTLYYSGGEWSKISLK
ncbi:hypothetical protein [Enterovibrio nigricans]|uniref:Aerolysin/Pertussis toxin (APT) domain-containing protein n=1 Tax=Enterovibrio nigricans DSM 22720 TaxID=1121868 RepID=A0A1T4UZK1_9GAMM|nr:hypothetical protein [Enterovibrio nigricans]PKF50489.1 hypothetical protein AT251_11045 [Enterovibrio nigricans]SKA58084.1 Aerolysin/Pertussis toxin (APT) domain-containing protein [Enterovibrio nigricans DSM 22720]